jgi:hypothetical protein
VLSDPVDNGWESDKGGVNTSDGGGLEGTGLGGAVSIDVIVEETWGEDQDVDHFVNDGLEYFLELMESRLEVESSEVDLSGNWSMTILRAENASGCPSKEICGSGIIGSKDQEIGVCDTLSHILWVNCGLVALGSVNSEVGSQREDAYEALEDLLGCWEDLIDDNVVLVGVQTLQASEIEGDSDGLEGGSGALETSLLF